MSNAALALALGAGTGLGLWYLMRDDEQDDSDATPDRPAALTEPAPTTATTAVQNPAPCAIRLDAAGLTADGVLVDVPSVVARCQSAGAAELTLADDAPTAVYLELAAALQRAGITLRLAPRRNARGARGRRVRPQYTREGRRILRDGEPVLHLDRVDLGDQRHAISPHEADALAEKVVDLLNGARRARRQSAASAATDTTHRIFFFRTYPKNGNSRTRFYQADPPTTWEDAKRRLVAAGLLDERVLLPTEWKLVADPPLRVAADRLRPLP